LIFDKTESLHVVRLGIVELHLNLKVRWLVFSTLSPFNTPVIVVKTDTRLGMGNGVQFHEALPSDAVCAQSWNKLRPELSFTIDKGVLHLSPWDDSPPQRGFQILSRCRHLDRLTPGACST
jgi:hypothetical protein